MFDSELILYRKAKDAELSSNWREAAGYWKQLGRTEDYDACIMIAEATERGDSFRRRVLDHAGPEPQVCGPKEDSISWMNWFKKMNEVTW